MAVRRGIFVAIFDDLADPARVAGLAARAEKRGWDGVFVWDHIAYDAPVRAVADPWVTLAAVAVATERVVIGPMVTPLPRRRVQKLARETVTLDVLSRGRVVLGAGLGGDRGGELSRFGEELDPRQRARLLDARLDELRALWDGGFEPRPVRGHLPVWLAVRWPKRRPLRRAARWDGVFPIDLEPAQLAEYIAELRELRGAAGLDGFDVVVTNRPGTDLDAWERAGATWCLTGWGPQPSVAEVERVIDAGPQVG